MHALPRLVVDNIGSLLTMGRHAPYSTTAMRDAAVVVGRDGLVEWVGYSSDEVNRYLEDRGYFHSLRGVKRLDAGGMLVMPGLVDCHTHLDFNNAGYARVIKEGRVVV